MPAVFIAHMCHLAFDLKFTAPYVLPYGIPMEHFNVNGVIHPGGGSSAHPRFILVLTSIMEGIVFLAKRDPARLAMGCPLTGADPW
jgi:hypothetical protein